MPDSDFAFVESRPVLVGDAGDHDFVFAKGESVTDRGESEVVFEAGTGIGGTDVFRAILRDSSGNVISDIQTTEEGLYGAGGFGLVWNSVINVDTDGKAYWDNFILDDGTIIDDFSDGDLSEYRQDLDKYTVSGGEATNIVSENNGNSWFVYSMPGDGLNYYPEPGDTWTYEVQFNDAAEVAGNIFGVQRSGYENDGSDPETGKDNEPNSLEVSPRPGNGDFIIREWDNADGRFLAQDSSMNWSNYFGERLEVEIRWR